MKIEKKIDKHLNERKGIPGYEEGQDKYYFELKVNFTIMGLTPKERYQAEGEAMNIAENFSYKIDKMKFKNVKHIDTSDIKRVG